MLKGKEVLFTAPGVVETVEKEFKGSAELQRDELFLKTEYTLISPGTELDCLLDRIASKEFPRCLGYSGVARVLKCGSEAAEFSEGDRVLVYHSSHRSYLYKNKANVVKVPDGLDPVQAVFAVVGCMGFQGVRKIKPELGEAVMIMGLGLLGQIAAQCAALSGAFPLIVLDFNEFRRKIALEHGADHAFSPDEPDLIEKVRSLTRNGKGVNGVVEVTGAPSAVKQGLKMTAPLGRIALVGCSRTPTTEIDFYNDVHRPGIQIIGAHNFVRPKEDNYPGYWTMRSDMAVLMDLIRAGKLDTKCLLSEVVSPDDAPSIYPRFIQREKTLLGVVFDWSKV